MKLYIVNGGPRKRWNTANQRDSDATNGRCQVRDDIYELLNDSAHADGVAFGSPIYLHNITAELRAFIERFVYQYINFNGDRISNAPQKLRTAMIYSMNVGQERARDSGYEPNLASHEEFIARQFGYKPVRICAYNTYQFEDDSQYRVSYWDAKAKAAHRDAQFPKDLQAAYDAGREMALARKKELDGQKATLSGKSR